MPRKNSTDTKIYVLDTNILLHEPHAFLSFKEHDVVICVGATGGTETVDVLVVTSASGAATVTTTNGT